MINNINHWILNRVNPTFNDKESLSLMDLVGRLTTKMNELIDSYNKFTEVTKKYDDEFKEGILTSNEVFRVETNTIIKDFTEVTTLRLDNQDAKIDETVAYMKDNLAESTEKAIIEILNENKISVDFKYNEDTEELTLVLGGAE